MSDVDIEYRILKYLMREASSEDLDILSIWILEKDNEVVFDAYTKAHLQMTVAMNTPDTNRIKENLKRKIKRDKMRRELRNIIKYSAAASLLIGLTVFYNYTSSLEKNDTLIPGEESITLETEEGKIHQLIPTETQEIKGASGNVIGFQKKSTLDYRQSPKPHNIVYNKLHVPYGKQMDIYLSDGTHIYLNSGSTLRYPIAFIKGNDRVVFLNGEAYFDVAKNEGQRFLVNAGEIRINVLGTKFNVTNYNSDPNINTTLVEGSISIDQEVFDGSKQNNVVISPGYKAEWNKDSKSMKIENVDTRIYTAWTQGKLIFRNTSFREIRKRLERKYNVIISNNNADLDAQLFDATFDIETLEEVMESFSKSYAIDFKILNNQVIIE